MKRNTWGNACACFVYEQIKVDAASGWNVPGDCDRLRSTMPIHTSWHHRNTPLNCFCDTMTRFYRKEAKHTLLKDIFTFSYTLHPFCLYWFSCLLCVCKIVTAFLDFSCFVCRHCPRPCVVPPSCSPLGMFPVSAAGPGWSQRSMGVQEVLDPARPTPWPQPGTSDLSSSKELASPIGSHNAIVSQVPHSVMTPSITKTQVNLFCLQRELTAAYTHLSYMAIYRNNRLAMQIYTSPV